MGKIVRSTQPAPASRNSTRQNLRRRSGSIQRYALATFCIVFLVAGFVTPWLPFLDEGGSTFASGTLLKLGVVLLLAWLAAPQLERLGWERLRGSVLLGLIIVAGAFAIRPRLGVIVGIIFVVGALFFSVIGWIRKLTANSR